MRVTNYYYCYWHHQTRPITYIMLQSIYLYLSMSKQMEFHLIFYYIIIWHLMRWYFDNLFLMRQLLLESKGASTYSLYPPAEQINYSYRMGIRGVGLCKGNILQELENWGVILPQYTWSQCSRSSQWRGSHASKRSCHQKLEVSICIWSKLHCHQADCTSSWSAKSRSLYSGEGTKLNRETYF